MRPRQLPTAPRLLPLALALLLLATSCDVADAPNAVGPATIDAPARETLALDQRLLGAGPTLTSRLQGAEQVVVATVERVSAAFGENEHGDRLILSTVTLRVHTTLRGAPAPQVTFQLEGGAVGALRLEVSDMPSVHPGERGLFALRRTAAGSWVPNRRGLGILRLRQLPDPQRLLQLQRAERGTR